MRKTITIMLETRVVASCSACPWTRSITPRTNREIIDICQIHNIRAHRNMADIMDTRYGDAMMVG